MTFRKKDTFTTLTSKSVIIISNTPFFFNHPGN